MSMRSRSTSRVVPGNRRDDGRVVAGQAIEQAGLAGVGPARQHHGEPVAQQPTLPGGGGHRVEVTAHGGQALGELRVGEKIDFLLRKIDGGLDIGAQLDQRIGEALHHAGELALQRAHGGARRLARAGIDEIGDGFGLRQIDLVVVKGALGEFTGPRAPRAELQAARDQRFEDDRAAMALQLEHVLAGVGMRAGKEQREADVDGLRRLASRKRASVACRAAGSSPTSVAAISGVFGPETRTTPTPPRPGGVAAATMVSG